MLSVTLTRHPYSVPLDAVPLRSTQLESTTMTNSPFRAFSAHIKGITPYSQSKMLNISRDKGEDWDTYESRVWRLKMHTTTVDDTDYVSIPAAALTQCVVEFAKMRSDRIPGKGMKTWAKPFVTGVRVFNDVVTSCTADVVYSETHMCDAQGSKGSGGGSRVPRTFPCIKQGWTANPVYLISDETIPLDTFLEYLTSSGYQIGIGRWRPQNGGSKGMFAVASLDEVDPQEAMGLI